MPYYVPYKPTTHHPHINTSLTSSLVSVVAPLCEKTATNIRYKGIAVDHNHVPWADA